jgi:hypothetical protein
METITKTKPMPDAPVPFDNQYTLAYKAVHNVGSLFFNGPSDMREAIKLGRKYCEERRWRFIHVRPMFHDILETPQSEEERSRFNEDKKDK